MLFRSSIAGLGIVAGLGFGGGSRFGVGLGLVLGPRRLQAPNTQQGSSLPEDLNGWHKVGCWSGSVFSCKRDTRRWSTGRGGLWNPLGQLQPGLGNHMLSFQVTCRLSLHRSLTPVAWCCHTFVLGPHREKAIARIRVQPRDVARAEATLVS